MTAQVLKLLIIIMPYINKWTDDRISMFCSILDSFITVSDDDELVNFLENEIKIEEAEKNKGAGNE